MKKILAVLILTLAAASASAQTFVIDKITAITADGTAREVNLLTRVELDENTIELNNEALSAKITRKDPIADSTYYVGMDLVLVYDSTDGRYDCKVHVISAPRGAVFAIEMNKNYLIFKVTPGDMVSSEGV